MEIHNHIKMLAMVMLFSDPDPAILKYSHTVLLACQYQGSASWTVVSVKQIAFIIAMVPLLMTSEEKANPCVQELYG